MTMTVEPDFFASSISLSVPAGIWAKEVLETNAVREATAVRSAAATMTRQRLPVAVNFRPPLSAARRSQSGRRDDHPRP
jgi:hypothetical protein